MTKQHPFSSSNSHIHVALTHTKHAENIEITHIKP